MKAFFIHHPCSVCLNPVFPPPGCQAACRTCVKRLFVSLTSIYLPLHLFPSMNVGMQFCVWICMFLLECPLLTVHSWLGGSGVCNYPGNKTWNDSTCLSLVSPFLCFSLCLSADSKDTLHHITSWCCALAFCLRTKL